MRWWSSQPQSPNVSPLVRAFSQLIVFKDGNPVMDVLCDPLVAPHDVRHRLFRESCTMHCGTYVKDLSQLGRAIEDIIIIGVSSARRFSLID